MGIKAVSLKKFIILRLQHCKQMHILHIHTIEAKIHTLHEQANKLMSSFESWKQMDKEMHTFYW